MDQGVDGGGELTRLGWRAGWVLAGLIPAVFLTLFFAWPAATLVARGFHDGTAWTLDGFTSVFESRRTWRAVGFTLWSATAATAACLLLGLPGAYLLYRTTFPGRNLLRAVVTIPFVLPTVVVGVAFGSLLRADGLLGWLGLAGTPTAILAAMVFFNYAIVVRTVGTFWARLDPRLAQAAATLGAGPVRVLRTVTLPTLAPAILSAASLVFLFSASSYGIVMVLGQTKYNTIETEIWFLTTQLLDLPSAAALSITQLVIVTLALWLSGRAQTRMTRALRLQPDVAEARSLRLGRDWPPLLVTAGVVIVLLGLPLINLLWRSLHLRGRLTVDNFVRLATQDVFGTSVWAALRTSLTTAATATVLAVTLGMLVALVASRRPRRRSARSALSTLESLFLLPLGVSAVTVGFGYLITLNRPPLDLRSSIILIPIAQAVVALPLVVRTLLPTLRAIDPRQLEAAATLGSAPLQVFRRIELPHLRRGLGLAIGFALATSLGEFGATSFLARPDNPTLPVLIFRLFGRPGAENYGLALAASVVLAVLAGATMALAERMRPQEVATW
ncbi:MAG TPA: iron ABC transporter permease [Intrasporangiaceae bacterium]|nr:iron ABC transporter permease [Intrasporangiaceae bacterium]